VAFADVPPMVPRPAAKPFVPPQINYEILFQGASTSSKHNVDDWRNQMEEEQRRQSFKDR
jgi:hypothetical protein